MQRNKFPREVLIQAPDSEKFEITIFLGIYNGVGYLENLKSQLLNQNFQKFHLVVVDNNSSDESFHVVSNWAADFPDRITIARNILNLGGSGTLLNNFDLIKTAWFSAFHQDDSYMPNHIQVLVNGILASEKDVVAISTVMGSMANDGKIIGTIPRASMFAKSIDPPSAFLQNLRIHSVPWPASAFRSEVFDNTFSPWHSTAFPDTEQILRMCAFGRFKTIDQETMFYRENAVSESHIINTAESQTGTALSLCRVFNSEEFRIILSSIEKKDLRKFAEGLVDAIDFRFQGSSLGGFMSFLAIEALIENVGYKDPNVLIIASSLYKNFGSNYSHSLFSRLAAHVGNLEPVETTANRSLNSFKAGFESLDVIQSGDGSAFSRVVRSRLFQNLPYKTKTSLISRILKVVQRFNKFSRFKFDWH